MTRYAIEVFHRAGDQGASGLPFARDAWVRMDDGPGGRVWRPRPTAQEAAWKCLMWTGCTGIPAMRVVDLEDGGAVVWQWGREVLALTPLWHQAQVASVKAELRRISARERPRLSRPTSSDPPFDQDPDRPRLF